ncbi:MAG: iron chelate uptake ABC transporter family permease subunit [Acidimicrobiales bacterium]|nr:iron chelate uptake ABC transporter family permease subunit [Acidimicrobiales bacterium]
MISLLNSTATKPDSGTAPVAVEPSRPRGLDRWWSRTVGLALLGVLALSAAVLSIAVGAKSIPFSHALDAVFDYDRSLTEHLIVRELRVPRTVLALAVGAALGLAGSVMQGVTRNPLADPGLLGVNAGAALGVVTGIGFLSVSSPSGYVWFAFAGAAAAGVAVYGLGSIGRGGATPVKLAIAGAAMSALLGSFTSAMLLLDSATLDQYRFWAVGSVAGRDLEIAGAVAPFLILGAILAMASSRALNGLALGEDVARSLGQRVGWTRAVAAASVVLLCGAATAAVGPIWFVGLTVPHVARAITGPDHRWMLPYAMVAGAVLLTLADVAGRVLVRPGELEVGVVTAFLGAPVFIAFVRQRRIAEL